MKKRTGDWSSKVLCSRRLHRLNTILLVLVGAILSANCFVTRASAQSDMGGMNVPADSSTTAKSSAASSATVELTTDPSPPQKGSNTIKVKLTSKDGKPIEGAKVTVMFFMAAMPEMGMAAMKTVITTGDKGGGSYEGKGDIGSGGDWQVTVKATKAGHVVATKKLTLNVAGGM
jgi:hypothetical protein